MLNPFSKAPREKLLAAEILKLRSRATELSREIADGEAVIATKHAAVDELHIRKADAMAVERATELLVKAEADVRTRYSALAKLESEIGEKEAELADVRDAQTRKATVETLDDWGRHFDAANTALRDALTAYAVAAGDLGAVIFEAKQLHDFALSLSLNEIPVAADLVSTLLANYRRSVQSGSAPASLPLMEAPAPKPVVTPPETTRVFTVKALRWRDPANPAFTRTHPQYAALDLPPNLAAEAIAGNVAVDIGDPRVGLLKQAHAPKHMAPEQCVWLGDHDDEPADEKPEAERLLHSAFEKT